MIVTTTHARYRVEEQRRGEFLITLLEQFDDYPPFLIADEPPGHGGIRRGPIHLKVGVGFCYDYKNVQQVDCDCNRIVKVEQGLDEDQLARITARPAAPKGYVGPYATRQEAEDAADAMRKAGL